MTVDNTYRLVENGQAIECLVCHQVCWDATHVQARFCSSCKSTHPIRTETNKLARHCGYSIQELPVRSWLVNHAYSISPETLGNMQSQSPNPIRHKTLRLQIFVCHFNGKRLLLGMAEGRFNSSKKLELSALGAAVLEGVKQLPGAKTEFAFVELGFPHPSKSVAEMVYDAMNNCVEHSRIVLIGDIRNSLNGLITPLLGLSGQVRLAPSGRDLFETLDEGQLKGIYQTSLPNLKRSFWHPDSGLEIPLAPQGGASDCPS